MRRFSKLKKITEALFVPNLGLEIHCTVYHKKHHHGTLEMPRLWVTLNKEIIFDFLKDFKDFRKPVPENDYWADKGGEPVYWIDVSGITDLIKEYIETPVTLLFDRVFENDYFSMVDILKAADRRIGKKRLLLLKDKTQSQSAKRIIDTRLGMQKLT